METRQERLIRRSKEIGTKHQRKLRKYSDGFNEKFNFFLNSYRNGLLSFSGSIIDVIYDPDAKDAKESFRMFEDGQFKGKQITTTQPNVLFAVIAAKKGWGLWSDEWTDGIVDWCFSKEEILDQFEKVGLKIPDSFLLEFNNRIHRKKIKIYDRILNESDFRI